VLTSGLAKSNPFLLQIMADVLGQTIFAPEIDNPTCVGAAIHGAVAAGVVKDCRDGGERFGARQFRTYQPDPMREAAYCKLFQQYSDLSGDAVVRASVRDLG
jgi:L-ribulokinase